MQQEGANKGPVLYKHLVLYKGGYPGVPEGSGGELVVQDGAVRYSGRRQHGKIQDEPIIMVGDTIAHARYVSSKRGVEIDGALAGETFTATFGLVALNPEKEGQRLVGAIEAIRSGVYGIDSQFEPDSRSPYRVRHVMGIPNAKSGQECAAKVYDRSILIWRARGVNEHDEKAPREWTYEIPLGSVHSARIETGERLVAMRIIATGIVGLLWKKKDKFLVLEWDEPSGLTVPVVLSFNAANEALAEIQQAKMRMPESERASASPPSLTSASPVADRIRQLKQLLDEGVISEADYEAKKADLLDAL